MDDLIAATEADAGIPHELTWSGNNLLGGLSGADDHVGQFQWHPVPGRRNRGQIKLIICAARKISHRFPLFDSMMPPSKAFPSIG